MGEYVSTSCSNDSISPALSEKRAFHVFPGIFTIMGIWLFFETEKMKKAENGIAKINFFHRISFEMMENRKFLASFKSRLCFLPLSCFYATGVIFDRQTKVRNSTYVKVKDKLRKKANLIMGYCLLI
jgi:predicted MPP superfamily phosphohydrolase